ncbi:MAG: class I SAM-dependent RNA methyltransferase [Granulosicoccus sp.]
MSKDKSGWNKYRRGPARTTSNDMIVDIDSLGNNGEGVGRHEGQVVFVPYTLPGERVRVKPTSRKKSFIRGQVLETLKSSPDRQTPPCHYFGQCGGCDWQHLPYELQLDAKVQHLIEVLTRIGKIDHPPIKPIIASDKPFNYRNRIQGVVRNKQFHYRQRSSSELVAINNCVIAEDVINEYLDAAAFDGLDGKVEIAVNDGELSVLPINDDNATDAGFRQVNTCVNEHLTRLLASIASEHHDKRCIDLYCGRGNWSIDMAQRYPDTHVIGVDSSETNIGIARDRAINAGISNVRFQHGRVEKLLKSLPLASSFCIVDPPRAGLDEAVCSALCHNPPQVIVYISCHPASLARDLALLIQGGFKLESMTPLDMFPQTAHLETLSILEHQSSVV